ncbi:MAG: tetratricopeptide repeat protein [Rhodanobacteraceae bacterium]
MLVSALAAAVAVAIALPAQAQTQMVVPGEIATPDYGSDATVGGLSNNNFNTPESDGRPGEYYFDMGAQAFRKGDYQHAIDMYKVAASWAYETADYNLAIMYFKGQGVPADRARGTAWMILAAERGDPLYVKARDLMVTALTKAEFAQADEIWNQLKPTYSDAVALRRAKGRWAQVKGDTTGSRVGDAASEHLMVGGTPGGPGFHVTNPATGAVGVPIPVTGGGVFKSALVTDGSAAYKQFQQSNNPYDPAFINNRAGTATIGPLQQVKPGSRAQPPSNKGAPASSSSSSQPAGSGKSSQE